MGWNVRSTSWMLPSSMLAAEWHQSGQWIPFAAYGKAPNDSYRIIIHEEQVQLC